MNEREELELLRNIKAARDSGNKQQELQLLRGRRAQNSVIPSNDADYRGLLSYGTDIYNSVVEPALAIGSGIVAEPIAGLVGIGQSLNPFEEQGAGERAVAATLDALTFQPRSREGAGNLQNLGKLLEPLTEAFGNAEKFLGDTVFEATDSPALAAAAATLPTLFLEVLGVGLGKGGFKQAGRFNKARERTKALEGIDTSVPTVTQLKETSSAVFKEIDDLGVRVRPRVYNRLVTRIEDEFKRGGGDVVITGDSARALERIKELDGSSPKLSDLNDLRETTQNATGAVNGKDADLALSMVHKFDQFFDTAGINALQGTKGKSVAVRYKMARDLWGRSKRSILISKAIEKARKEGGDFGHQLREQFRLVLGNPNQKRLFKTHEIDAMNTVVRGTKGANLAKILGNFALSEHSIFIPAAVGSGAALATLFNPVAGALGSIAFPVIGFTSKSLAKKLTKNHAKLADQVIRAGKDAEKITRAYYNDVPEAQRSVDDLTQLLQRRDIDFKPLNQRDKDMQKALKSMEEKAAAVGAAAVIPFHQNGATQPNQRPQDS